MHQKVWFLLWFDWLNWMCEVKFRVIDFSTLRHYLSRENSVASKNQFPPPRLSSQQPMCSWRRWLFDPVNLWRSFHTYSPTAQVHSALNPTKKVPLLMLTHCCLPLLTLSGSVVCCLSWQTLLPCGSSSSLSYSLILLHFLSGGSCKVSLTWQCISSVTHWKVILSWFKKWFSTPIARVVWFPLGDEKEPSCLCSSLAIWCQNKSVDGRSTVNMRAI